MGLVLTLIDLKNRIAGNSKEHFLHNNNYHKNKDSVSRRLEAHFLTSSHNEGLVSLFTSLIDGDT
jgi:hypothetical protein